MVMNYSVELNISRRSTRWRSIRSGILVCRRRSIRSPSVGVDENKVKNQIQHGYFNLERQRHLREIIAKRLHEKRDMEMEKKTTEMVINVSLIFR